MAERIVSDAEFFGSSGGKVVSDSEFFGQPPQQADETAILSIPGVTPEGRQAYLDLQERNRAIGQGLMDIPNAGAQIISNNMPDFVNQGASWLGRQFGMASAMPEDINANIAQQEQAYQAQRSDPGSFDWGRLGGNVLGTLPLGMVGGITARGAMLSGAAAGGLTPQTEGDYSNAQTVENAGFGLAGGLGGNLLTRGLARIVQPVGREAVQMLTARGVQPTVGQRLGGVFNRLEERLSSIPFAGDMMARGRYNAWEDLNRAVYADILEPIGGTVPDDLGRAAVQSVRQQISQGYDQILPDMRIVADDVMLSDLGELTALAGKLPRDQARVFTDFLSDDWARTFDGGNMDGISFKRLDADLRRLASGYGNSATGSERMLGDAFMELRAILRGAAERSSAGTQINVNGQMVDLGQRLRDLNLAWAKNTILQRAAARTGATDGVFSPAQLLSSVRQQDGSLRNRAFAEGEALLQPLAEAGKDVLGNTVPNSGTPERVLAALVASGAIDPKLAVMGGLLSAPYTPGLDRVVGGLLSPTRPPGSAAAANFMRDVLPGMGLLGAGAASQIAN